MWRHHIDERRNESKQVQSFGLASIAQTLNPGRTSSDNLQDRSDISSKVYSVNKIGPGFNEGHTAETQQSLLSAHRTFSSLELSPLDPSSCLVNEQLDKPSGLDARSAQMIEPPRHSNLHAEPSRRCYQRSQASKLARAGSIPKGVSLAPTAEAAESSRSAHTLHGRTSAPAQLHPPVRISDMFRTKRASHSDLPRTFKKACVRPTLSLGTTPFGQELSTSKHDFQSVSSQMASEFDAPYQQPEDLSQENVIAHDILKADDTVRWDDESDMMPCGMAPMKADDTVRWDEESDMMPCGMAPMPNSPTCNIELVGLATRLQRATPATNNHLVGRSMMSPSVHTPPGCMAMAYDQPPGAPRKRTKSSSSGASADSFDECESVFAPGAPDWSPRTAVCRVLKFDDDMDE